MWRQSTRLQEPHYHRCHVHAMAPEERCPKMFLCADDCVEDDQETIGFCPEHQKLADELEAILDGAKI